VGQGGSRLVNRRGHGEFRGRHQMGSRGDSRAVSMQIETCEV
jgi:hypothetical protein